jgi:hypothetical protein
VRRGSLRPHLACVLVAQSRRRCVHRCRQRRHIQAQQRGIHEGLPQLQPLPLDADGLAVGQGVRGGVRRRRRRLLRAARHPHYAAGQPLQGWRACRPRCRRCAAAAAAAKADAASRQQALQLLRQLLAAVGQPLRGGGLRLAFQHRHNVCEAAGDRQP